MAGIDANYNITLSRAGDFLLPLWVRSKDGNFVDATTDTLVFRVEGGFGLAAIPHPDPDKHGWKLFHFTAALANSLPDFAVPYCVVRTTAGGYPEEILNATIVAEGFA